MKQIKDYIHHYIGSWVIVTTGSATFQGLLKGVYNDIWYTKPELSLQVLVKSGATHTYKLANVKLLLRPLSDMTEEEFNDMWYSMEGAVEIRKEFNDGSVKQFDATPAQVAYMLSKGFDLFNLIESGLAIDKTTLKEKI